MNMNNITVTMTEHPSDHDWYEVKRRALKTMGYNTVLTLPDHDWKHRILKSRHSPIRRLPFSFDIECPYWVSVHLCRHHVGTQPYVRSQRNDRQSDYDRNSAPQDAPVAMIWDLNADALLTLANKRLCNQASAETRHVVQLMCDAVLQWHPEFESLLVPNCIHNGGVCHEMYPCGMGGHTDD